MPLKSLLGQVLSPTSIALALCDIIANRLLDIPKWEQPIHSLVESIFIAMIKTFWVLELPITRSENPTYLLSYPYYRLIHSKAESILLCLVVETRTAITVGLCQYLISIFPGRNFEEKLKIQFVWSDISRWWREYQNILSCFIFTSFYFGFLGLFYPRWDTPRKFWQ